MTKNIIFIIAALCSLQARADVQPTERDTVHRTYRYDDTELLQPLQPLYLDGVVVPARGNGNWFVSIAGGATAFLGTPLGCEDLFGRLKPSYSLALGKWFTPWVGARINYNGCSSRTARWPCRSTIISMRICCGMCLAAAMYGRNWCAGIWHPLRVSDCCTMRPTGITHLQSPTAYKGSIAFPKG